MVSPRCRQGQPGGLLHLVLVEPDTESLSGADHVPSAHGDVRGFVERSGLIVAKNERAIRAFGQTEVALAVRRDSYIRPFCAVPQPDPEIGRRVVIDDQMVPSLDKMGQLGPCPSGTWLKRYRRARVR